MTELWYSLVNFAFIDRDVWGEGGRRERERERDVST